MHISHINLWLGIYHDISLTAGIAISRYVTISHLRSMECAVLKISCSPPHSAIIIMHCGRVYYNYNALHGQLRLTVVSCAAKESRINVQAIIKNATTMRIYTHNKELVSTPTKTRCYLTNIP